MADIANWPSIFPARLAAYVVESSNSQTGALDFTRLNRHMPASGTFQSAISNGGMR